LQKISYAQNFEDVILDRVFQGISCGFYIDVGAFDPNVDSVTKHFYNSGWRGINIEPIFSLYENFLISRPRDININCLIADVNGEIDFFEIYENNKLTGLSTADKQIAIIHEKSGMRLSQRSISAMTLETLLSNHLEENLIHFLKIDVEGLEAKVLKSGNFERFRPWVIIIEGTVPNTQLFDYQNSDDFLKSVGYTQVYIDGLNCFYLADEHLGLLPRFALPPNVFDGFHLSYNKLLISLNALENEKDSMLVEFEMLRNSLSWRLTLPLRKLKQAFSISRIHKYRE
jgi:FkbM family methyltransferase